MGVIVIIIMKMFGGKGGSSDPLPGEEGAATA